MTKSEWCSRHDNKCDGVINDVKDTPMLGRFTDPVLWSRQSGHRAPAPVEELKLQRNMGVLMGILTSLWHMARTNVAMAKHDRSMMNMDDSSSHVAHI